MREILCEGALMKLRHAAALAAIGWYLMRPAINMGPSGEIDKHNPTLDNVPISQYWHDSSYDSAAQCEQAKLALGDLAVKRMKTNYLKMGDAFWEADASSYFESECIATDDPRIKGN